MKLNTFLFLFLFIWATVGFSQKEEKSPLNEQALSGLKLRNIGPAFASGRIADIAIHPDDDNVWYVAVGSGGVWKTINAGTTWEPIFDKYPSYSTGCITIDPNNPHTIWLGTGENVGGRHVGFGDGIYMSPDDGDSWKHMGLKESQHISKIIVHPGNSHVIWVAVQGPLWSKGGERGLYKSTDGGANWKKVLGDEEWTGVTDIVLDPRNPDWMYAATWDRHRTVAAYMGGGPGSGIHRSTDGGETWEKLSSGLPRSNMGKIGLAVSPQQPDVVYAAIELDLTQGGVFRSSNRGASWSKMSNAVSGGTGPHYYQELYACPHQFDRLYLMDNRTQISEDGGKTFSRMNESARHGDNHAMAFRMDDPDYLLFGTDGGVYESFDLGKTWRMMDNMPITQYYKVAVDDRKPFYHIYGGTQDNGSHGGPSRTDNVHGIRNADWYKTLGADGHQSATEPGNPNIMYAETQQGGLHRVDRITGEQVYIQPQPAAGEDYERFNWDAPILVSPHSPSRLYFASQRVWRSENRGDSWTPISDDLTRNQNRLELPIMGRQQSWDNPWDMKAMSNYNSITSLAESPLQAGLLYAGTDDGIIQVSEDGGANWRKVETSSLAGVPATAFVNDIRADLHDANTVYVSMDNHKNGDFKPYLFKSTDRGKSWKSITGNMPEKLLIWRTVQDHVKANLLFAATEFGIYVTLDGGEKWFQLKNGVPTISFRDITIQRRENDLVAASFGRGFFVLDDISPLREMTDEKLQQKGALFSTRKALWYRPRSVVSSQGSSDYSADNPPFGAVFTYHLSESFESKMGDRKKTEGQLNKEGKDIPFPGWEALDAEKMEERGQIWLIVKDNKGEVVDRIAGNSGKGLHRTAWDLRHASTSSRPPSPNQGRFGGGGAIALPGKYTVTLAQMVDGETTILDGPSEFEVVPLREGALKGASPQDMAAFRKQMNDLSKDISLATYMFEESKKRVKNMESAISRTNGDIGDLAVQLHALKQKMNEMEMMVSGSPSKNEVGEKNPPNIRSRMFIGFRGMNSTYGPTEMHKKSVSLAQEEIDEMMPKVKKLYEEEIPALERALMAAGAPWMEGMVMPKE